MKLKNIAIIILACFSSVLYTQELQINQQTTLSYWVEHVEIKCTITPLKISGQDTHSKYTVHRKHRYDLEIKAGETKLYHTEEQTLSTQEGRAIKLIAGESTTLELATNKMQVTSMGVGFAKAVLDLIRGDVFIKNSDKKELRKHLCHLVGEVDLSQFELKNGDLMLVDTKRYVCQLKNYTIECSLKSSSDMVPEDANKNMVIVHHEVVTLKIQLEGRSMETSSRYRKYATGNPYLPTIELRDWLGGECSEKQKEISEQDRKLINAMIETFLNLWLGKITKERAKHKMLKILSGTTIECLNK